MSKIILLVGEASCGKTTTLKMLIAMFLPYATICKKRKATTVDALWREIDTDMKPPSKNPSDFGVVFELFGKKIGIHTKGDSESDIKGVIKFFSSESCDIIVMPCHPNMNHISLLNSTYGNDIYAIPKQKSGTVQERYFDNISKANELFQLITKLI